MILAEDETVQKVGVVRAAAFHQTLYPKGTYGIYLVCFVCCVCVCVCVCA